MEYPDGPPVTATSILVLPLPSIVIVGPYRGLRRRTNTRSADGALHFALFHRSAPRPPITASKTPVDTNSAPMVV